MNTNCKIFCRAVSQHSHYRSCSCSCWYTSHSVGKLLLQIYKALPNVLSSTQRPSSMDCNNWVPSCRGDAKTIDSCSLLLPSGSQGSWRKPGEHWEGYSIGRDTVEGGIQHREGYSIGSDTAYGGIHHREGYSIGRDIT